MAEEGKGYFYEQMIRDLLRNLGYNILSERHSIKISENEYKEIDALLDFNSKVFLRPIYSPTGLTMVECKSGYVRGPSQGVDQLYENLELAKNDPEYKERFGEIAGGILIAPSFSKDALKAAKEKGNIWCWDQNRLFFYVMKVFAHSLLENWVGESRLGFVLKEEGLKEKIKSDKHFTSNITGIRYSMKNERLEFYFVYFVDCDMGPGEFSLGINALSRKDVEVILNDVVKRIKELSKIYLDSPIKVTIEIHSLPGFTEDAEFHTIDYVPTFTNWRNLGVEEITMDEHTLFKYSIIPWEAVMDYASTKKLYNTIAQQDINLVKLQVEEEYTRSFKEVIEKRKVEDPFYNREWNLQPSRKISGVYASLIASITDAPIKQILILFKREDLHDLSTDIPKIVSELEEFNYKWIGVVSAASYTKEEKQFVEKYNKMGIGLGLIDATRLRLVSTSKGFEGDKIRQMFLVRAVM